MRQKCSEQLIGHCADFALCYHPYIPTFGIHIFNVTIIHPVATMS